MEMYYDNLIKALPDAPILLGRDRNFRSAVFVPFTRMGGKEYILFEKRARGIRQEGEICFPGGMVDTEKNELSSDAAVRETVEELGIKREKIRIERHVGYFVANIGTTIDVFAGRIQLESLEELNPSIKEVESLHHVPFSFFIDTEPEKYMLETEIKPVYYDSDGNTRVLFPARELGLPEKYHAPWQARKTAIYVYRYQSLVIWGLTAAIIHEIAEMAKSGGNN